MLGWHVHLSWILFLFCDSSHLRFAHAFSATSCAENNSLGLLLLRAWHCLFAYL